MKKEIYLSALAALCAVLATLGGCTSETDILSGGTADGTPLIVRATASGFQAPAQSGDSPATRTPVEDGLTTTFQPGDAIGLFCIRLAADGSTSISTDIRNLKVVYTQAADGTTAWKTEEGADGPVYYTDAQTYVAYYPYKPNLSTTANDEQALRTELKTLIEPKEDQSTPESLTAGDLMIAAGAPVTDASERRTLTLNFKHENALLVIRPMSMNRCIAPAVLNPYSYHAEAKVWGIDKNITKTTAVDGNNNVKCKMLVYDFIQACEMSDGSYRAIVPGNPNLGQILCSYTTSDGTSPLPVSATGTAITGGIKANTCYTLEIHSNLAKAGEVERAVQPGDFVVKGSYSNLKIYPGDGPVDVNGKIPDYANALGIVTSCSRIDSHGDFLINKWIHALVMVTKKNISNIGSNIQWCIQNRNEAKLTDVKTIAQAKNYMGGYTDTKSALSLKYDDYPVFENLIYFREDVSRPNNISFYFLPSTGEWYDLITNLGGKSPDDFNNNTEAGWSSDQDGATILGAINARLNKIGEPLPEGTRFPCSTEAGNQAWMVKFNGNTIDFSPADKALAEYTPVFFFGF